MDLVTSADTVGSGTEPRPPLRIVLLAGQRIVRHALRALFDAQEHLALIAVVGDTSETEEALALIESARPDVLISHLCLGTPRVQHIEEIHARFPQLPILVLSEMRTRDAVTRVRRAGARGYLGNEHSFAEMLLALRQVASGRWYRGDAAAVGPRRAAPDTADPLAMNLTERQRQVLRLIALGYSARETATQLGVSVNAVYRQRERLRDALQLQSTAALTRFAAREGLAESAPAR